MQKNLVLFFTIKEFENVHLYKDVGLLPYYLCKEYMINGKIVYSNKNRKIVPKKFRNLELEEIKFIKIPNIIKKIDKIKILENFNFYKYLLKNAKQINYLMFFHYGIDKIFLIYLYKFLNPFGKVYIKLDTAGDYKEKKIKKIILKIYEKKVNLFSVETLYALEKIKKLDLLGIKNYKKLAYIPNGFDEDYLIENRLRIKNFEEKENIMITVGRLGAPEKNNELLLEALEKIDLKDWKVLLIGDYTEKFKDVYDKFIEKNQIKKNKVILIGNVVDRKKLYDYYNRAKIFILTSRCESFGIVLVEALRFGNYIITTDVGAARDITKNGEIGSIIDKENTKQLENKIKEVIYGKINLKERYESSLNLAKKFFLWNNIIKNNCFKKIFNED